MKAILNTKTSLILFVLLGMLVYTGASCSIIGQLLESKIGYEKINKKGSGPFTLTSADFTDANGEIKRKYVEDGISPALKWSNTPKGTTLFYLLVQDPQETFIPYWLVRTIPSTTTEIAEGTVPTGGDELHFYTVARPFFGEDARTYVITIYATNKEILDDDPNNPIDWQQTLHNDNLGEASIQGRATPTP